MSGGRLKYLAFSVLPLLILSVLVYRKINPQTNEGEAVSSPAAFSFSENKKEEKKEETFSFSLQIKGEDDFKENVKQALKLIWTEDKESFYFIRKYVFEIRQERKTGFYFDEGSPIVAVSQEHASRSLTWLAGVIAHNAWHAYREVSAKSAKKVKRTVPEPGEKKSYELKPIVFYEGKTFESFLQAEKEACAYQAEILKKIGASGREINEVLNRGEKDFTMGHDGEYFVNN
ncbi:MAG: hypothetical protein GX447_06380 [Elusimicrobia bacterium]|nr:hypothetical protein [Elusimicrobiota bacterium]